MNLFELGVVIVLSYLLGSISTALWVGKAFHNVDIREHGSGNAGATNVVRVLGWKTGIPVMIIDVAKSWLATMLPAFFNLAEPGSALLTNIQIIAGVVAIVGHVFPVYSGFRGGKGVASVFGALLALQPLLTLGCMGVFLIVLLTTGIVSIASISAGIAFPILLFSFFDSPSVIFKIFSVFIAFALIVTHRKNIGRLIRGEESKLIKYGKKDKSQK